MPRRKEVAEWCWIVVLKPGSCPLNGSGDKKYTQKSAQDGSGLGIVTHKASWRNETLPA